MTRRTVLKATGAALLAATAGVPLTQLISARSGPAQYTCQFNSVRLRDRYGLSAGVIGVLNTGDVVNITGDTVNADGYTWMPVTVNATGTAGWTAMEFFEPVLGTIVWPVGTVVHVNSDNVNLRSRPSLSGAVIGNFDAGTNASVFDGPQAADGWSWHGINIGGTAGWMATDFLTEGRADGGQPVPGDGFRVGANVRPTTALNLRTGAGTGYNIIGVYTGVDVATIIFGPQPADGYTWYQVEMWDRVGTVGWFAGEYLEGARFEPTGARHRVIDGPLNLRENAGLASPVITTIPEGDVFVIRDASFASMDGHTWMWVNLERDPSVIGWVAQGFSVEV